MISLHRLVYYSRAPFPDLVQARAQIGWILAVSRRNNPLARVTGALTYGAGGFGQVLEGPGDAVEATFERIQRDPRHNDVMLLGFGPVPARSFDEFSMAFVGDHAGASRLSDIIAASGFVSVRNVADRLFEMLYQLTYNDGSSTLH